MKVFSPQAKKKKNFDKLLWKELQNLKKNYVGGRAAGFHFTGAYSINRADFFLDENLITIVKTRSMLMKIVQVSENMF
jgi:hypothetical protein